MSGETKGRSSRSHWRSLEALADDPRAREFLEREFPEGASEAPQGINRRTMLTLLGASLSMAGLTACRRPVEKIVPHVKSPEEAIPGVPRHYATTMPFGLDAYGLVVESHEGRPTKIEGNEQHPSSLGATNALIQASILDLYDPDRSQGVLQNGEPARWESFVAAWRELEQGYLADGGGGLAVLTESSCSPTMARLAELFLERFPWAYWATYEPVSDENLFAGAKLACGAELRPLCRFDQARVILALDCDFLLGESDSVRQARGFADGRRVLGRDGSMSRLWVVEGVHSVTGANADHRLPLPSSRIPSFLAALAARLRSNGLDLPLPSGLEAAEAGVESRHLDALARDLMDNAGKGLIVSGRRQPPAVHAAVLALNAALKNVGATIEYRRPESVLLPKRSSLRQLVGEMEAGGVSTLVVIGGNPVLDAPSDLGFEEALSGVTDVVHLSSHVNETSRLSGWHINRAHYLESWGDARAVDGTPSVVQPLILPLFEGKSDVEMLGLLAEDEERPGYDLVRETWASILDEAGGDTAWSRVLHDGVLAQGATPLTPVTVLDTALDALVQALPGPMADDGLEVAFVASPALHDGRFANNGWLQELPDPLTKITWDNAALLSPQTAREYGLGNGDLVTLGHRGSQVELPAWIVPGQADGMVALLLGYGRQAAGRVGNGVGVDLYPLRTLDAPDIDHGLVLSKMPGSRILAQTQDHGTLREPDLPLREGRSRPIVREATLEQYRSRPEFAREMVEAPQAGSMWQEHQYEDGYQWGMTIDLNACIGCNACVIACQSENNIPVVGKEQVHRGREMHWIRMDRYFSGPAEAPRVAFQAVPCMQCENAPCEQVCPVAATVHDSEGLNVMVYNRCIGTRYCSNNCPYKVRRFNYFNFTKDSPEIVKMLQNPDVTVRSRGVMEKCTYCTQRINAAKIGAKLAGKELEDGDVQTACQQACPTRAIQFGNLLDSESGVAHMKREPRNYELLEGLYTKPRTTYLAKLRNPHPDLDDAGPADEGGH